MYQQQERDAGVGASGSQNPSYFWSDLQEILNGDAGINFPINSPSTFIDNNATARFKEIYREIEESCRIFESRMMKSRVRRTYTPYQLLHLEEFFAYSVYPTSDQKHVLAILLDVSERRVRTWFHNRRQKHKKMMAQLLQSGTSFDAVVHGRPEEFHGDRGRGDARVPSSSSAGESHVFQHRANLVPMPVDLASFHRAQDAQTGHDFFDGATRQQEWHRSPAASSSSGCSHSSGSSQSPVAFSYQSPDFNL